MSPKITMRLHSTLIGIPRTVPTRSPRFGVMSPWSSVANRSSRGFGPGPAGLAAPITVAHDSSPRSAMQSPAGDAFDRDGDQAFAFAGGPVVAQTRARLDLLFVRTDLTG